MQTLRKENLRALINAVNYAQNDDLSIAFVATGLSSVKGLCNDAVPSAPNALRHPQIAPLSEAETHQAFREPAQPKEFYTNEAVSELWRLTKRYPFFIQTYGSSLWLNASSSPISLDDVTATHLDALEMLDAEWFASKVESLTDVQMDFLFALAADGDGEPEPISQLQARLHKSK